MCETKVFVNKQGSIELLMEDVIRVIPEQGGLKLTNLFGEEKNIKGEIEEIQLLEHRITIKPSE